MTSSAILEAILPMAEAAGDRALLLVNAASHAQRVTAEAHPLGMVAIRFKSLDSTVRIHIRNEKTHEFRDEFGQVHDHIWDLESHVLLGQVENSVFDLCEHSSGEPVWLHDYDTQRILAASKRAHPILVKNQVLDVGNSYNLPAGIMHTTKNSKLSTITLVSAVETSLRVARILGSIPTAAPKIAVRRTLPLSEALQHIYAAVRCNG